MDTVPSLSPQPAETTTFESQTSDEQVLLILRAHQITNAVWIALTVVMVLLPLIFAVLGIVTQINKLFQISWALVFGFLIIYYLFIFAFVFQSFLTWYFNVYLVTNKRIVDTDFVPLFYQKISSCELEHIEDITASINGFLQSTFNFGDLMVQTASEKNEFRFVNITNPEDVQKVIEQAMDKHNGNGSV